MRLITLVFLILVVLIQYPLWFGRGGWLKVHEMGLQLEEEQKTNAILRARNDKLAAEVKDLKEGAGAVEERARYELGMIKEGEVFVQIVDPTQPLTAASTGAPGLPTKETAGLGAGPSAARGALGAGTPSPLQKAGLASPLTAAGPPPSH
jgi:cell division protein FtsB